MAADPVPEGAFKVGDVISMAGPPDRIAPDLVGKFFRVEAVDAQGLPTLSLPYLDAALTHRYHPVDPQGAK